MVYRHRRSFVLAFGGAMASAVARAYNGGLGAVPSAGSRGRAPGGRSPPEAEHNYTFHKPIFAKFWCHFGKIQSFCKLLKLGLHVPWQFFRKHKRCCFDKLMYVGPQGRLSPLTPWSKSGVWGSALAPQRVRVEPGRQTVFGEFQAKKSRL